MRHKNIFNKIVGVILLAILTPLNPLMLTSCSDEPDSEYFYTFTGEMMSDYLKNHEEYSEFAEIIERADMMDLLATYGRYTCFAPNNDAIDEYLKARGLSSVSELSDSVCDTIARTHLVKYMYTTADLVADRVPTQNMMHRYIATEAGFDNDSNAVVVLEGQAKINFYLKDDSVENGIMQPIDKVIEKSNKYISDLISKNPRISTFYLALIKTGVIADVQEVQDPDWDNDRKKYTPYSYMSNSVEEKAIVPKTKNYGYTFFIEPNEVLESKYGIQKDDIHALYELACQIYDPIYPQDMGKEGHDENHLTDSINPLHRFVQYHILNKKAMLTDLTPIIIEYSGSQTAIGIDEAKVNPTDWHYTLLPHTMIKVERPTAKGARAEGEKGGSFINRRYDGKFSILGARIEQVENEYIHDAINGHYFYVDDIVAFSEQVQKTVQGIRIRMDFNAIFPEIIGNGLRSDGDRQYAGDYYENGEGQHGNNYFFPLGYLDGVTFNESCYFLLRRPCIYFNCYQWDEMNLKGDYDITFRLPPVPFDGDWQLRLGFTVYHDGDDDRGVAQVYVDNIPQGIPLDMRQDLSSSMYLGDSFSGEDYDNWTDEQKDEQQKTLKNLGAYIYPACMWRDASGKGYCHTQYQNMRRILCQTKLEAGKDHFLRLRKTNEGKANDTFMLDFLELVPKSVYAGDGDQKEDDL